MAPKLGVSPTSPTTTPRPRPKSWGILGLYEGRLRAPPHGTTYLLVRGCESRATPSATRRLPRPTGLGVYSPPSLRSASTTAAYYRPPGTPREPPRPRTSGYRPSYRPILHWSRYLERGAILRSIPTTHRRVNALKRFPLPSLFLYYNERTNPTTRYTRAPNLLHSLHLSPSLYRARCLYQTTRKPQQHAKAARVARCRGPVRPRRWRPEQPPPRNYAGT